MSFRELSEIIEMLYPERAIMCTTPRFRKFSSSSSGRLDRSPIVSPARKELCGSGRTLERFSIKECFVENKNFFSQNPPSSRDETSGKNISKYILSFAK